MSGTGAIDLGAGGRNGAERPLALVFAMPPVGHFQRLRPLVPGLVDAGLDVVVATHARFREDVERSGARFLDLFARFPLDGLDEASEPPPVRFVTYAGHYADEIVREAERLAPDLVVYDTFAVIGRVVALALGVPYVNVCSGHDRVPARVLDGYRTDPRVRVSPACERAVRALRARPGLDGASHLSWVDGASPYLNVYGEPPAFLSEEGCAAFAPLAHYGCLSVGRERPPRRPDEAWGERRRDPRLRVFACLGSVGWRLFHRDTRQAVEAVVAALAERDDAVGLVSLGLDGVEEAEEALRALRRPNVEVRPWVDQWDALHDADVFVTHAGLNSVHEAIYLGVPMVTYPLFADQPSLARHVAALGVGVRLVDEVRAPVAPADVHRALDEVGARRVELREALAAARALELEVIAGRPAVARRIASLAAVGEVAR